MPHFTDAKKAAEKMKHEEIMAFYDMSDEQYDRLPQNVVSRLEITMEKSAVNKEVLEALVSAYDMLNFYCQIPDIHTGDYMDVLEECKSAIAKARGEK